MAYIRITKPVNGLVNIEYDARKGPTGYHARRHAVPVRDVASVVGELAEEYKRRKDALANIRRGILN